MKQSDILPSRTCLFKQLVCKITSRKNAFQNSSVTEQYMQFSLQRSQTPHTTYIGTSKTSTHLGRLPGTTKKEKQTPFYNVSPCQRERPTLGRSCALHELGPIHSLQCRSGCTALRKTCQSPFKDDVWERQKSWKKTRHKKHLTVCDTVDATL